MSATVVTQRTETVVDERPLTREYCLEQAERVLRGVAQATVTVPPARNPDGSFSPYAQMQYDVAATVDAWIRLARELDAAP